ncbi:hypothetical protein [Roseovarius sp.]|uniref:hypothetical protein n=1 Tax=Roseovarius sp. TaxID=1486281 RepID=UPI003D10B478
MICYHGGPPGLKVGARILPASVTGVKSSAEFGAAGVCDPGKVYVTPDPRAAAMFASLHPSGDGRVYKVRTVGGVAYDPDCTAPGLSYVCDAAVIVGRVRVKRKALNRIRRVMMQETGLSADLRPP